MDAPNHTYITTCLLLQYANEEIWEGRNDQKEEMRTHVLASSLDKLKLDDRNTIGLGYYYMKQSPDIKFCGLCLTVKLQN